MVASDEGVEGVEDCGDLDFGAADAGLEEAFAVWVFDAEFGPDEADGEDDGEFVARERESADRREGFVALLGLDGEAGETARGEDELADARAAAFGGFDHRDANDEADDQEDDQRSQAEVEPDEHDELRGDAQDDDDDPR